MKNKVLFALFAVMMLAVLTTVVSADQDAYERYCNIDQYGCWNTGDNGAKDYIMFWSESSRAYFMGPDSNAPVSPQPAPSGRLPMGSGKPEKSLKDQLLSDILGYMENNGYSDDVIAKVMSILEGCSEETLLDVIEDFGEGKAEENDEIGDIIKTNSGTEYEEKEKSEKD